MPPEDNKALRAKIVRKLASNQATGDKKVQVQTLTGWGFASNNEGKVKILVKEMKADPGAPIQGYGGRKAVVRLTSMEEAKEYIRENGGELPWGLRD